MNLLKTSFLLEWPIFRGYVSFGEGRGLYYPIIQGLQLAIFIGPYQSASIYWNVMRVLNVAQLEHEQMIPVNCVDALCEAPQKTWWF